jgi:hypothetical protein
MFPSKEGWWSAAALLCYRLRSEGGQWEMAWMFSVDAIAALALENVRVIGCSRKGAHLHGCYLSCLGREI